MAVERDCDAERSARIELLMADGRRLLTQPTDPQDRHVMRERLEAALRELGGRVPLIQSSRTSQGSID